MAFLSVPYPDIDTTVGSYAFCFAALPVAQAMTRAESGVENPATSRRPHAISPDALTSQVVYDLPDVPWHDADRERRAQKLFPRGLDNTSPVVPEGPALGVHLYTPHCKPVSLFVKAPEGAALRTIIDTVLDCAPSVPDGVTDRAVPSDPLRPQRVEGSLSLIRFPGIIGHAHDGDAAIVVDLTHVHGAYSATVMPKSLSYAELLNFVDPAAADEDPPFWVYIGGRQTPWPCQAMVTLRDGDVVTVVRHGIPPPSRPSRLLAETLANPRTWGPAEHFFEIGLLPSTCVMCGGKRYCVAPHHHTDQTLIQHTVQSLRLDVHRIATCTFRTDEFDVRGHNCRWTVAVADVPAIADSEASRSRQDFFVLCDLRPLGLKPVFLHTHAPKIHVPSFLSDFGIELPPAVQLCIQGGKFRQDYMSFNESCILLFFTVEADPSLRDDSSSEAGAGHESYEPSSASPPLDLSVDDEGLADLLVVTADPGVAAGLIDPTESQTDAAPAWDAGDEETREIFAPGGFACSS